jgi:hypothetical protein
MILRVLIHNIFVFGGWTLSKKAKRIWWIGIAIASPFVLFKLILGLVFLLQASEFFYIALDKGYNYAVCQTCTRKDAIEWSLWFYPTLFIHSILPPILRFLGVLLIYKKLIKQ